MRHTRERISAAAATASSLQNDTGHTQQALRQNTSEDRLRDAQESLRVVYAMQQEFDASYFRAVQPDLCKHFAVTDIGSHFAAYINNVSSRRCDPNADFSEDWYLTTNPDVSNAVAGGAFRCGFEHWVKFGRSEGRGAAASKDGSTIAKISSLHLGQLFRSFDSEYVLAMYRLPLGIPRTADHHKVFQAYLSNVRDLFLDPNESFSERYYLERNSDVRESVRNGTYHCGFHHWIAWGHQEGRIHRSGNPNPDTIRPLAAAGPDTHSAFAGLFDSDYYTQTYLAGALPTGRDAFDHFMHSGLALGHIPVTSDQFDEDFYSLYYHDVRVAKESGRIPSGYYHFVVAGRGEGRVPVNDTARLLQAKLGAAAEPVGLSQLHVITERIAPLNIRIDDTRPVTLNLFVPTLDPDLMFGGYIAFLHFISRLIAMGYRVRFLLQDDVYCSRDWFLRSLQNRPRWLAAFRDAEFHNCTRSLSPVFFNRDDVCVAYSTWTMLSAWSVANRLNQRKVLFFIQEYEPIFYENGSFQFASASAYRLPHFAIFNSPLLKEYFKAHRLGVFAHGARGDFLVFRHALANVSPDPVVMRDRLNHRRLICYARPERHAGRNLFEICILALRAALREQIFPGNWAFHGIGSLGREYEVDLDGEHTMTIASRIAQDRYENLLRSFDVGLSLMWAPHPSVIPFELARAGVVTVTNEYGVRTHQTLAQYGFNIVTATPTIDGIVAALATAVERSADVASRTRAASFDWPVSWDRVFDQKFITHLERHFAMSDARRK
jgi:hypothetical protein